MGRDSLKKDDMDFTKGVFGIRLDRYIYSDGVHRVVKLYIENDEYYHYICEFHPYWLEDLKGLIEMFEKKHRIETKNKWMK